MYNMSAYMSETDEWVWRATVHPFFREDALRAMEAAYGKNNVRVEYKED